MSEYISTRTAAEYLDITMQGVRVGFGTPDKQEKIGGRLYNFYLKTRIVARKND